MAHDSIHLCSKGRNSLSFKPRVDIDLNLDGSFKSSSLDMHETTLCDKDLDDYDVDINCLQAEYLHLQVQKKQASDIDYKTLVQSSISPFSELPNEIICIIFEFICTENLLQDYPWPLHRPEQPITHFSLPAITYLPALAISAVCTRWRSLTLASPTLWSRLRLETGTNNKSWDGGFMSTLELYLDRSDDAPLSISLATVGMLGLFENRFSVALDILLDHNDRWRTFSYTGDYELKYIINDLDRSYPILENLILKGDRVLIWPGSFKMFKDAPKLLTITTEHIANLPLSWNQLTSLQISEPLAKGDICSLHVYPDLTHLKVLSPWDGFRTCITLAKLESFTFVEFQPGRNVNSLLDMFSSITLPSLTKIVIASENDRSSLAWPPDAFSAFVSRSACILTTLSLRLVSISDRSLIAAFRILPSLVNFSIGDFLDSDRESPITSHFISCMSASSLTPLLPNLHSLSITTDNASFDDAAFVDMVSSRWLPASSAATRGIDCLRSLVLHLPMREVDEEIYMRLENLDRMGMRVVVTGKRMTGIKGP